MKDKLGILFENIKIKFVSFLPAIKKILKIVFICLLIIFLFVFLKVAIIFIKTEVNPTTLITSLINADISSLDSYQGRTNFLVLGGGGEGHEAGDLTDTMMFVSLDLKTSDVVLLSIPRDIWLDSLQAKVNSAYHYGEERGNGQGFKLARDSVEEIVGQPIHYSIFLDFEGFVKIVDLLGGVNVKVDRSFDDYKYPIPGKENDECDGDTEYKCRYEHIHFDAGWQEMDGKVALKFIRSRNAEGEEGTDFARSQRQQKIILAIKDKLFSLKTFLNSQKILDIKKTFESHVAFDKEFSDKQIGALLSLFVKFVRSENELRTLSLDTGTEESPGFLYNPPISQYGQWVLIPTKSWEEIEKYLEEKIYKGY